MLYVCVTAIHNMLHSYIISLCVCIQSRLQDACIADTVKMEISGLQDMNLSPALSWVQEHSLFLLNLLLTVLQNAAQILKTAGVDVSLMTGGKKQKV